MQLKIGGGVRGGRRYHNFLVYLQVASDVKASFDRSYVHVPFNFTIQILCKYMYSIFMVTIKINYVNMQHNNVQIPLIHINM